MLLLWQALAKVISKEIDTSEAVQKVLSGDKPGGFNKPGKSQSVTNSNRSNPSKPRNRYIFYSQILED